MPTTTAAHTQLLLHTVHVALKRMYNGLEADVGTWRHELGEQLDIVHEVAHCHTTRAGLAEHALWKL